MRWAKRKFKRLRGRKRRTAVWLGRQKREHPALFAHWRERGRFTVGTM